jgi:hypothetical protein
VVGVAAQSGLSFTVPSTRIGRING